MLSINNSDCLTCAIAEAKGLSYRVIYNSVRTLGKNIKCDDKEYMGMKRIWFICAMFTKKPLVLLYRTSATEGHAVAIINSKCIDNCVNGPNENRSVWWLIRNRNVISIFKAKNYE